MNDDAEHEPEHEPDLDEMLVLDLQHAVTTVGVERYLEAPLVFLDEHCFPDPWEPNLVGLRTALRRLMRHVGLPDVPVMVEDARQDDAIDGPIHDPVVFDGIEGGAAHFIVQSIGSPRLLVTWLVLEVVRAWAEYQGITRDDALAYRAMVEDVPEREQGHVLDDEAATVIGVGLGLGPLLAIGTIQTHKQEQLQGGYAVGQWSTQTVGGMSPMALARFLALYGLSRGAVPAELDRTRECFDGDLRRDFDAARSQWDDRVAELRTRLGVPDEPPLDRRAVDASPFTELDDGALAQAEQAYEERIRFFNRGRPTYAVIEHSTVSGSALGMLLWLVVVAATRIPMGVFLPLFLGFVALGGVLGRTRTFRRCSDPECRGLIGATDATCPSCGGTIKGQLRSANQRFDDE